MLKTKLLFGILFAVSAFAGCSAVQTDLSSAPADVSSQDPTPLVFPANGRADLKLVSDDFKKKWLADYQSTVDEIERNRKLWRESKIENYDIVCWQVAGGMQGWSPALIKVRGGRNISIGTVSKDDYPKLDGYENVATVDQMFDFIKKEMDQGRLVYPKYNPNYGYPEEIVIAYFDMATDGFKSFHVKKFGIA